MLSKALSLVGFTAGLLLIAWGLWPTSAVQVSVPVRAPEARAAGLPETLILRLPGEVNLGSAVELRIDIPTSGESDLPEFARAEARLELEGALVEPGLRLVQTVTPGKAVGFTWRVTALAAGELDGMLWLYWQANGEQLPVLARPLNVHARAFLGQPPWMSLAAGAVLIGCGLVLRLPCRARTPRKRK